MKIGVDFDGTLAKRLSEYDSHKVGTPIHKMVDRVRHAINNGDDIYIFTARAGSKDFDPKPIDKFCLDNFDQLLEITDKKLVGTDEIWDDIAVPVDHNGDVRNMSKVQGIGDLASSLKETMVKPYHKKEKKKFKLHRPDKKFSPREMRLRDQDHDSDYR